ncbi:MAG: sugar ABC transporter substrate-binding protein [Fusicatenibacter sp.]|nr:extracellular solute-binding protein [Fusicatenibacter sp.]
MKRKVVALTMAALMALSFGACGDSKGGSEGGNAASVEIDENSLDYQYGEGVTFHSDEPVTYSLLYSDHENYPYKEDWRIWSAIEEKTNVKFDMNLVARTDYNDKMSTLINTGDAPYIISKAYDETPYIDGGQIVAISDWVQYMPNYQKCVKEWGMEEDLKQIYQSNGKYYKLPGMWEKAAGGYSLVIRKDIFDAAGIDVTELEKNWTWDDFVEALETVKEYTGADYVWSDQFQGDSALNICAVQYGVTAGWGVSNGTAFDFDKNEFYFADSSEDFKAFAALWNKMYSEGLLDPESFSQDNEQAQAKFYRGDSYVMSVNYQVLADMMSSDKMQVEGADLYMVVYPGGPKGHLQCETSRLENGLMISKNALDELGEEEFVKMLRFVDWLWYSDEGQTLVQWGVEGETYTKDADGSIVLDSGIYYNGINPGAEKQLNVDFGFGGGVFSYGGSEELRFSKFTEGERDWNQRIYDNCTPRELAPPIMADEEQKEEMGLIQSPLIDYVNTSLAQFISGSMDVENDWEEYVSQCESKGSTEYIEMANEIFQNTKDVLGME